MWSPDFAHLTPFLFLQNIYAVTDYVKKISANFYSQLASEAKEKTMHSDYVHFHKLCPFT